MTYVFIGAAVLVFIIGISIYNGLINKKNTVDEALSSVDVMLKKRFDLIPNLVSAVQQYLTHERGLLTDITKLRTQLANAAEMDDKTRFDLENALTGKVGQMMIQVENYPDLKASHNFLHLQRSLNEIEEQISAARRSYNAAVKSLNNGIEMFPSNIFASMMSLQKRPYFEISNTERATPDVKNLFA